MRPRFHFPVLDHQTETEWLTQILGGTLMFIQVRTCSKHNRWNSTHSSSNSPSQKKARRNKTGGFTSKRQLHLPRVCSIKSLCAHCRISFCLETKSSGVAGFWVSKIKRRSFWCFSFDQIRRYPSRVSNPTASTSLMGLFSGGKLQSTLSTILVVFVLFPEKKFPRKERTSTFCFAT